MDKLNEFYIANIYTAEKVEAANRYFKLVLGEIFNTLYKVYDGENTLKKLEEKRRIYPRLIDAFIKWIQTYCKEENQEINKKLYDLKEKKDYAKAIIHYISGMTDKYAIDIYNEIISF